ncbi:MAG: hypothetical protein QOC85_3205 [Streptomyces sp.]|jgi:hypothetical protein|nr:hypothetical protein [Streptomyces sp.]
MQSESAIENRAPVHGRRRKSGNGSVEGPVFVDNSGRRARLLRRIGLLVGVLCLGYAVVLGMTFMGWGTPITPSSLLPFGDRGPAAQNGGPGGRLHGGTGTPRAGFTGAPPTGVPTTAATPTSVPSASVSASADAN